MENINRYHLFFLFLLFFFTVIRLFCLDQPIVDDETNYVQSINDPGPFYTINPFRIHAHPPLGGWFYFLAGNVLGQAVWVYRLVPLFFWLINTILVYLIVSREYSRKAALFSTLIMGFSYYSFLMSMQIEADSNLLVTTFLLISYFYLKYTRTKQLRWLLITGLFFGIALLTKISAIFFLGIIGVHLLLDAERGLPSNSSKQESRKNNGLKEIISLNHIKTVMKELGTIFGLGLVVFSIFPLLMWPLFLKVLNHSATYFGVNISWMALAMLLFWATPLLLGLFFFQMIKLEKNDQFWVIWFCLIFVIYTFLIIGRPGTHGASGGVADYSRHFMNLLVPLSVLGGVFLSRLKINQKQLVVGIFILIISLLSFFFINLNTEKLLPRDFGIYLNSITSFDLNFFFSFTTSSGNLLGVNMGIMIFCVIASLVLMMVYLSLQDLRLLNFSRWVLIIFIALGVALNIFLAVEYLGPITSPDVNSVFYEIVDYAANHNLKLPLYVNDEGLLLHLNNLQYEKGENQYNLGKYFEGLPAYMSSRGSLSGTILILNWPPIAPENKIFDTLTSCTLHQQFYSRAILLGEIYVC